MKKNIKGIYLFEILLFILVIMFNIFKIDHAFEVILILSAIFCYLRFGYVKDNAYEKRSVIRVAVASVMAFAIIMYALGLFTGFYKPNYDISTFEGMIWFILAPTSIISTEIIRYIVAKNCTKNKKPLIILTIVLIILNVITQISGASLRGRWQIFVLISSVIIPILARELLCSYIAYKCSPVPNIIWVLFVEVVFHLMPIVPDLGDYLYTVVRILLPATIFFLSSKTFRYHDKSGPYAKKAARRIILIPLLLVTLVMIYLVSGLFTYKMVAVGSGSMEPVFYRGDAVIYKKAVASELKVGDILAFDHGRNVITHRIVSINESSKGQFDIVTKGDNNNTNDNYIVQNKDVIGVVQYSVKYVGYPTLWVNQLIK